MADRVLAITSLYVAFFLRPAFVYSLLIIKGIYCFCGFPPARTGFPQRTLVAYPNIGKKCYFVFVSTTLTNGLDL
jgi:hypothetical protein